MNVITVLLQNVFTIYIHVVMSKHNLRWRMEFVVVVQTVNIVNNIHVGRIALIGLSLHNNNIHKQKQMDTNLSTFVYWANVFHYMFRP
jgi:hypothetical protein